MRQFAQTPRAAAALLILSTAFAVCAVELAFTLGSGLDHVLDYWLYDAVMIAAGIVIAGRARGRAGERLAWLLVGVAVALWGIGDVEVGV